MATTSFRFGIELEVVLTHKTMARYDFQSLTQFAGVLIDKMNTQARRNQRAQPQLYIDVGDHMPEPILGDEWLFRDEATIHTKRDSDQCMLELPTSAVVI